MGQYDDTKKASIILLALLSVLLLFLGIVFSSGLKNAKANGIENYQNYKGGKVKFLDWLFTDSRVLTIEDANAIVNDGLDADKFGSNNYSTLVDDIKIYNGVDNAGSDYVSCTPVKNKKNLSAGDITGIFMENGVDANGNVRYAFAYVGIPYQDARGVAVSSTNPVPAVVCIQVVVILLPHHQAVVILLIIHQVVEIL